MATGAPDPATGVRVESDGGTLRSRVGTIVWGLIIVALSALIVISQLDLITLNGTYVLVGLMIGAGAALVIGGLLSARKSDNGTTTGKS